MLTVEIFRPDLRLFFIMTVGARGNPAPVLDPVFGSVRVCGLTSFRPNYPDRHVGHLVAAVAHMAVGAGRYRIVALAQGLRPVPVLSLRQIAKLVGRSKISLVIGMGRTGMAGQARLGGGAGSKRWRMWQKSHLVATEWHCAGRRRLQLWGLSMKCLASTRPLYG